MDLAERSKEIENTKCESLSGVSSSSGSQSATDAGCNRIPRVRVVENRGIKALSSPRHPPQYRDVPMMNLWQLYNHALFCSHVPSIPAGKIAERRCDYVTYAVYLYMIEEELPISSGLKCQF